MSNVGQRIKDLRQRKKLTQKELAKLVNASPQKVSNWEREYTNPDHIDIAKIAEALDTTADYILFGNVIKTDGKQTIPNGFVELLEMIKSLPEEDQIKFYDQARTYVAGLKYKDK